MNHSQFYLSISRAACKLLAVLIVVTVLLVGAVWKLKPVTMLLAAAPVLFLGVMDADFLGMARKKDEEGERERRGDAEKRQEADGRAEPSGRTLRAAFSLSVLPFYLGLFAVGLAGSGVFSSAEKNPTGPPTLAVQAPKSTRMPPAGFLRPGAGQPTGMTPKPPGPTASPMGVPPSRVLRSSSAAPSSTTASGPAGQVSLMPGSPNASDFLRGTSPPPRPGTSPTTVRPGAPNLILPQTPKPAAPAAAAPVSPAPAPEVKAKAMTPPP